MTYWGWFIIAYVLFFAVSAVWVMSITSRSILRNLKELAGDINELKRCLEAK